MAGIEPVPPFSVYWDISHGVVDNYQPSGRYNVLVDHLAPLGFQFTEGNSPLDAADLNSFDVLVLANGSFASSFPTSAELAAVQSFVHDGGGLLIEILQEPVDEISGFSGGVLGFLDSIDEFDSLNDVGEDVWSVEQSPLFLG